MQIAVALKHVPLRVEIEPLTGAVTTVEREAGLSDADRAAIECALRLADAWSSTTPPCSVIAVTVGPAAASGVLREALAVGAARAVRVDGRGDESSAEVAELLAPVIADCAVVICGDYSLDRGSGSVPAFLAAATGRAQALGLVSLEPAEVGHVQAVRRLDGGRREILHVGAPAVLSVEGSVARLRRATLPATIAADRATLEVNPGRGTDDHRSATVTRRAFRPRTRVVPPPAGDTALERLASVTSGPVDGSHSDPVVLSTTEAVDAILAALDGWGYALDTPSGEAH